MRTLIRTLTAGAVLGAALVAGASTAMAAQGGQYPAPDPQGHTYSIPVGAVSDLGDLTKVANLGSELGGLLGH